MFNLKTDFSRTLFCFNVSLDAGIVGFPNSRYSYNVTTETILVPVQRTSGADGTISVSWSTKDATAVGKFCYDTKQI